MSSPIYRHKSQSTRALPESSGGHAVWQLPPRSQPIVRQPAPSQVVIHPHIARGVDDVVLVALQHKHSDVAQVWGAVSVEDSRNLASCRPEWVFEVDKGRVDVEINVFKYEGGGELQSLFFCGPG